MDNPAGRPSHLNSGGSIIRIRNRNRVRTGTHRRNSQRA